MDPPEDDIILRQKPIPNDFHTVMRYSMKMAQYFFYFPIDLGSGNGAHQLEFKWLHWRTAIWLINFILSFTVLSFNAVYIFSKRITFFNIGSFIFHLSEMIQFILFFKLTYHWPKFVKEWSKVDVSMRNYKMSTNLRLKLNTMTTIVMFLAGVELILGVGYRIKDAIESHDDLASAFKDHFVNSFPYLFTYMEYSFWIGLFIQYFNVHRSFNYIYGDLFVILIGTALAYRLRQVSERIGKISRLKVNDPDQWRIVRKDYNRLTELCQAVNSKISAIIIVSLLNNLYLVLVQLFHSMRRYDVMLEMYYYLSLGMMLVRISGLCILGGAVYEEWRNIGLILNFVGTSAYNQEVERMTYQVHSKELSLSGNNFFRVSRGLILDIAGAIVTYELVLIQFYSNIQV